MILGPILAAAVAAAAPAHQVIQSVSGGIQALAVSSDGYLATIDVDRTLRIWHVPSRTLVRRIPAALLGSVVSPPELVWDDATHEFVTLRGTGMVGIDVEGHLHEHPGDGERVRAIGGTGKARWLLARYGRWAVHDSGGQPLGAVPAAALDVAISGDGRVGAGVTKDALVTFSLDPIGAAKTIALPSPPSGGDTSKASLALTRDGSSVLVCVKGKDGANEVVLVQRTNGTPTAKRLALPDSIFGCDVAIDEPHGIAVIYSCCKIYGVDLATSAVTWSITVDGGSTGIQVGFRDRDLLVATNDGHVRIYDVLRGDEIGDLGHSMIRPENVVFGAGDALVVTRFDNVTRFATIWSLAQGSITSHGRVDWGYSFALGDGARLDVARASSDAKQTCYSFATGTATGGAPAGKHDKSLCAPHGTPIGMVDPVHARVIAGTNAKQELLATDAKPVTLADANGGIAGLIFEPSRDGKWIAGYNMQGLFGQLRVWDARTGKQRAYLASPPGAAQGKAFYAYAFSDDGTKVAVGGDDTATIYTLGDGKPVRTIALPASAGAITAVAFTRDGELALRTHDGHLAITRGGKIAGVGGGDGGLIARVVARRDGHRIATISDDGGVRLWAGSSGELEATLIEFADGEHLATTPGGAYAGAPEAAERVSWVFDAPTEGFSFERFAATFAKPDVVAKRLRGERADLAASLVRPPRVTLVASPPAKAAGSVAVTARVVADGKVAELRAFVEGRPAIAKPVGTASADITLDVPLEPGVDVVTLLAFDDAGRSSNPVSFRITSQQTGPRPEVWVVAAGVGWYPNLPAESQLAAPVNDARAIAETFAAQAGAGKIYADSHVTVLEDEQVTPESLAKAISGLSAMKPNDVAVVFLAGHGVKPPTQDEMVFLTSTVAKDPATWAQHGLGWKALGQALQAARGRVVVLLDACHSGHVTQELLVPNSKLADDLVHTQRAGVLVFAASKGPQESFEENAARGLVLDAGKKKLVGARPRVKAAAPTPAPSPAPSPAPAATEPTAARPRSGHGYFTGALIAALDSASTDADHDGVIELSEIISQVTLRVVAASDSKQTPWVARRELFGDFGLAKLAP